MIYVSIQLSIYTDKCTRGVWINVLNNYIVLSEFVLYSQYKEWKKPLHLVTKI